MDAETKSRLVSPPNRLAIGAITNANDLQASVPAWGSYLYQNFVLPAFSPTASMSEWLNLNTPFAALTPRASAIHHNSQQQGQGQGQGQQQGQAQGQDYFGSGWGKVEEGIRTDQGGAESNASMPFTFHGSSGVQQPNFNSFGFAPQHVAPPMQQSSSVPSYNRTAGDLPYNRNAEAGPSSYYTPPFNYNSSIATSLLLNQQQSIPPSSYSAPLPPHPYPHRPSADRASQPGSRASLSIVDNQLTHSPSPINSINHTPQQSPKRVGKRRLDSLDSAEEHDSEHEPDVPEGVERDGVIWGMKVEAYRALSARERKRVRNRISARTFRAKRKGKSKSHVR